MSVLSIGDLASHFQIRRLSVGLKSDLTRLGRELATGQKSDLGAALAGDFGPFSHIERSLKTIAAYQTANSEAASMLTAAQLALENAQNTGRDLAPGLLTAASARDSTLIDATAQDARQKLSAVVSSLNTRSADRTLFAGAATDRPALASGETILAEVRTATFGEDTAEGLVAAVESWFDTPGGGFDTLAYLGAEVDLGPIVVADGETVPVGVRADDQIIRDTLKGYVLAALLADGALAGDPAQKASVMAKAAERLLTTEGQITTLRAEIGAVEARIEDARARNAAEAASYELARAHLVAVDPYQTATELEAVYSQIDALYTVTSRLSKLKFTDYI